MPDLFSFDDTPSSALPLVGGKGLSLARTAAVGLPVPPGFTVTTDAYRRLHTNGAKSDPAFAAAVAEAYRQLGGVAVAVRSSATAEDGAETSFAGQQETILGVVGDGPLLDAIDRCWKSLFTERAVAYRRQQGVSDDGLAMAVVVQALVPADVAGVLFTKDPQDATGRRMSVEASWGLGEAVVSGRVTPDRFAIDRDTGRVLERVPGVKAVEFTPTGERPVPAGKHTALCMTDGELSQLAELGKKVEAFYGDPRDVEWAIAGGTVHLLQARPITTATAGDREALRQEVIASTKALVDPRGTAWVRYNLSESLPEPTPMTWAVVSRMLAADGAFGLLNKDLGGDPDFSLGRLGAFDLIAGRPMANLSRMPRLQFRRPPVEYPLAEYKADPKKALDPKPVLNPLRDGFMAFLRLPATIMRMGKIGSTTRAQAGTFAAKFTTDIAPNFAAEARAALAQDWSKLEPAAVVARFTAWVEKAMVGFARESLKPTALAAFAWGGLAELLAPKLGAEKAQAAVTEVAVGAKPPADAALADAVKHLGDGTLGRADFLARFGHRCRNEMELASPRWSEDVKAVDKLSRKGDLPKRIEALAPTPPDAWDRIAKEAKLSGPIREQANIIVAQLRTHLGLREAAKHYLLMGYAVVRRALVELDTRFKLNGGVFFLLPEELPDLIAGKDVAATITARKKRRQLELSLELPPVLFGDDLDAIGRLLPPPDGAATLTGTPLSAGVGEAPALVLTEPTDPPDEPYVLVCPSTDPGWVPLFAHAKALVMETGGVLSHGAIVAREFGLPAVAGLPGVVARLRTGQRLTVDGGRGTVAVLS